MNLSLRITNRIYKKVEEQLETDLVIYPFVWSTDVQAGDPGICLGINRGILTIQLHREERIRTFQEAMQDGR